MQVKVRFHGVVGCSLTERWYASEDDAESYLRAIGYDARANVMHVGAEFPNKDGERVAEVVMLKQDQEG